MVGGSVWLIAGEQRDAVIGMQGQLRASNDLLTAMLDQETGLRGYALTGEQEFLEPYEPRPDRVRAALRDAQAGPGRERTTAGLFRDLTETARQWQANARTAVDQVDRRGPRAISLDDARQRKALMDRFREQDAALRRHVEQRAQDELQHARWVAFVFVMLFSATVFSLGMFALERQARRERAREQAAARVRRGAAGRRRRARGEGAAAPAGRAAGARHERRRAHAQRQRQLAGGEHGPVRHPRARPRRWPTRARARAWRSAAPATHERKPGAAPLQTCELCHRSGGARSASRPWSAARSSARCSSSRTARSSRTSATGRRAVSQAAPILANLRNLAIAEHRAATDPLTGCPTPAPSRRR